MKLIKVSLGLLVISIFPASKTMINSPHNLTNLMIDSSQTFQVIEGFGAFNTLSFWTNEKYENKLDLIVNDLGLSIMRFELPPTFQADKDKEYDLNGEVFGGPDLQHNFKDVRELHARGVNKFVASIWSPPAWMKSVNSEGKVSSTEKGGSLRKDAYIDFADYCVAYCRAFKKETGVELYALGLQNEPEFVEPYNSCVYNPELMRETLRMVGQKFIKEGISTRIYLPEVLPAQQHVDEFFNAVNEDDEVRNYTGIFAIHNYDEDGMNVGGAGAKEWEWFNKMANSYDPGKQLWMTETSGHKNNWQGAMLLAANIYNALYYGNINAWIWWAISDNKESEVFALIIDGKPTSRYYVSKHFYKFIRPGAVRIKAESCDPDLLTLAFKNSGNSRMVCILINKAEMKKEIQLPGLDNKILREIYLSSQTESCKKLLFSGAGPVEVPGMSIMTITWNAVN